MKLDPTLASRLKDVHPDLVRVVRRAAELSKIPFSVVEGRRSLARQKELLKVGATRILRSRHITGHAVDLVPLIEGKPRWDWSLYLKLAQSVRAAAVREQIPVRWGGTWELLNPVKGAITPEMLSRKFPDGPHFELPRERYPS